MKLHLWIITVVTLSFPLFAEHQPLLSEIVSDYLEPEISPASVAASPERTTSSPETELRLVENALENASYHDLTALMTHNGPLLERVGEDQQLRKRRTRIRIRVEDKINQLEREFHSGGAYNAPLESSGPSFNQLVHALSDPTKADEAERTLRANLSDEQEARIFTPGGEPIPLPNYVILPPADATGKPQLIPKETYRTNVEIEQDREARRNPEMKNCFLRKGEAELKDCLKQFGVEISSTNELSINAANLNEKKVKGVDFIRLLHALGVNTHASFSDFESGAPIRVGDTVLQIARDRAGNLKPEESLTAIEIPLELIKLETAGATINPSTGELVVENLDSFKGALAEDRDLRAALDTLKPGAASNIFLLLSRQTQVSPSPSPTGILYEHPTLSQHDLVSHNEARDRLTSDPELAPLFRNRSLNILDPSRSQHNPDYNAQPENDLASRNWQQTHMALEGIRKMMAAVSEMGPPPQSGEGAKLDYSAKLANLYSAWRASPYPSILQDISKLPAADYFQKLEELGDINVQLLSAFDENVDKENEAWLRLAFSQAEQGIVPTAAPSRLVAPEGMKLSHFDDPNLILNDLRLLAQSRQLLSQLQAENQGNLTPEAAKRARQDELNLREAIARLYTKFNSEGYFPASYQAIKSEVYGNFLTSTRALQTAWDASIPDRRLPSTGPTPLEWYHRPEYERLNPLDRENSMNRLVESLGGGVERPGSLQHYYNTAMIDANRQTTSVLNTTTAPKTGGLQRIESENTEHALNNIREQLEELRMLGIGEDFITSVNLELERTRGDAEKLKKESAIELRNRVISTAVTVLSLGAGAALSSFRLVASGAAAAAGGGTSAAGSLSTLSTGTRLAIQLGIGAGTVGGTDAINQLLSIHVDKTQTGFHWDQTFKAAGTGAALGPIIAKVPAAGQALNAWGAYQGTSHALGAYDRGENGALLGAGLEFAMPFALQRLLKLTTGGKTETHGGADSPNSDNKSGSPLLQRLREFFVKPGEANELPNRVTEKALPPESPLSAETLQRLNDFLPGHQEDLRSLLKSSPDSSHQEILSAFADLPQSSQANLLRTHQHFAPGTHVDTINTLKLYPPEMHADMLSVVGKLAGIRKEPLLPDELHSIAQKIGDIAALQRDQRLTRDEAIDKLFTAGHELSALNRVKGMVPKDKNPPQGLFASTWKRLKEWVQPPSSHGLHVVESRAVKALGGFDALAQIPHRDRLIKIKDWIRQNYEIQEETILDELSQHITDHVGGTSPILKDLYRAILLTEEEAASFNLSSVDLAQTRVDRNASGGYNSAGTTPESVAQFFPETPDRIAYVVYHPGPDVYGVNINGRGIVANSGIILQNTLHGPSGFVFNETIVATKGGFRWKVVRIEEVLVNGHKNHLIHVEPERL